MTVRTIDEIFRDFVIDGVPASGPFHPYKPDLRDTLKALLEGISTFPDNRVIRLNNANEGTANNIVVTASVAIPAAAYQVLYILNVTQENTGPVTVSGAINRDLVTNTSRPIEPGYLKPGMALLSIDTGTQLRLLSYGDAEAILAAAEAAAERAEDAAAAVNLPPINIDDAGKALIVKGDGTGYEASLIDDPKVATPTTADQAINSSKLKLDLRTDNPNMIVRLLSDKFRDVVSARDFGAFGMGNDYSDELQAFFTAMKPDGKKAWVPRGEYGLSSTLVLNNHETNNVPGEPIPKNMIIYRTQIVGDGSGSTIFRVAGDIVGLHIASGQGKAKHGGFSVVQDQAGKVGRGLLIDQTQGLQIEDVEVKGFSVGLTNRDSFSINYISVDMIENDVGFVGENVISGSHPNALNFSSCRFIYNGTYGCLLRNPTTCNFVGGSFESNGDQGNPDHIALNIAGSSNEGAFGCNLLGVYFENNAGFADVAITNIGSGSRIGMHRINGCTFNRISSTRYTEHNVYINKSATGFLRAVVSENSFQGFGTYVPDPSRAYILSVDGGGGAASVIRENNVYGSPVETPV